MLAASTVIDRAGAYRVVRNIAATIGASSFFVDEQSFSRKKLTRCLADLFGVERNDAVVFHTKPQPIFGKRPNCIELFTRDRSPLPKRRNLRFKQDVCAVDITDSRDNRLIQELRTDGRLAL